MKININNEVKIKLTARGKHIHKDNWNAYGLKEKYIPPKEDTEGWSTWQLWTLFQEFGSYMYNGCEVPFETEIEIIKKE